MNLKWMALVACAGYGIWFAAVGGKRIDNEHVNSLYKEYAAAYLHADGKALCDLFGDNVHGAFSSKARSILVDEVVSKASACSSMDNFLLVKKELEASAGQELSMNIDYSVQSITIAPDRQSAVAEVLLETRVGHAQKALLDMRATRTDVIRRSFGKAQIVQSDGTVSFYR